MSPDFAPDSADARPLWAVWAGDPLPAGAGTWPAASGFSAKPGEICLLPDAAGGLAGAILGLGERAMASRQRFLLAHAAALPQGTWRPILPAGMDPGEAALALLLGQYRFTRYKGAAYAGAQFACPDGADAAHIRAQAAGEFLTRDLINTPANHMGPQDLEDAARALADETGAAFAVTTGADLLDANLPMIHAVGRAAEQAPRLIDLRLGDAGPRLTVVGKGVCFDTGGLDIKPSSAMAIMKKDMGGAATALGLLRMLALTGAADRMRVRLLLPVAENSVSAASFRPGDVLTSRKGLTVEVNNTDAEGRLILADALALGAEDSPELMISLATLTGAARVALGPDLPPFYCDDDATAEALARAAMAVRDPLWRMPFWDGYDSQIEPAIADLDNAPSGGMAGSVTAALFLRRFAAGAGRYVHMDIYGWQPVAAPGRPKGGLGQGARAILAALPEILP